MTRSFAALAGVGLIATAAALAPAPAEAQYYHRNVGGAVAAGAVLGLAAGAIIGSTVAPPPPAYYYGPPPRAYAQPVCYLANRRVWIDGMGWTVRRVEVCE